MCALKAGIIPNTMIQASVQELHPQRVATFSFAATWDFVLFRGLSFSCR